MAKNQGDFVSLNAILPKGLAIYPKLNDPDTKFDDAGVYEVKVKFEPEDAEGILGKDKASWSDIHEAITAMRDEFAAAKKKELASGDGKAKKKASSLTVLPFGEEFELDDDGNETSYIVVKAKMKASGVSKKDGKTWTRKPTIFDAKGKVLTDVPAIWGGSTLKVAVEACPYYTPKDNEVGITLRLQAVQIIDLVSGGGSRSAEAYGFGAEDGYTLNEEAAVAGFADESQAEDDGNF